MDDLDVAFFDSPVLEKIYHIRENFCHILDSTDAVENVMITINNWAEVLTKKEVTLFDGFIKILKSTKEYMADYIENYLLSAVTEVLSSLIRSV